MSPMSTGADAPGLPEDLADAWALALAPRFPPHHRAAALRERVLRRARARSAQGAAAAGTLLVSGRAGTWKRFLPRVHIKLLYREGGIQHYLLRLAPRATLLPHDHPHTEECIVLEGEIRMGSLVVRAGDYHVAAAGTSHDAIHCDNGALLYLRGAVPAFEQVKWSRLATLVAVR